VSITSRWPILYEWQGFPIPDLRQIPPEDWVRAVRPLRGSYLAESAREQAIGALDDADRQALRIRIIEELTSGQAPPLPLDAVSGTDLLVDAPPPGRRRVNSQQVNLRITAQEYLALADAAQLSGLRPTQLARTFVLNGTRRLLHEARVQAEAER